MSVQRVRDAPRLIEWTGERCVPWAPDPPVIIVLPLPAAKARVKPLPQAPLSKVVPVPKPPSMRF